MKHIWIMNHYAGNMLSDRGGRHYSIAKYLKKAEYEPVIFCCNARHGAAETFFPDTGLWQERVDPETGVPFVFVRGRCYADNGTQRVGNMIDFYRNVKKAARQYAALHGKPDILYASSVHPLTLVAGIQLARRFGVRCICEVRDLWPESIVAYSRRFTPRNPLIRLLYRGEKWIYQKADAVLFTMEGGYDYIKERRWERWIPRSKVYVLNNGVDLEQFLAQREQYPAQDEELQDPATFRVVYTGSIRRVNHLDTLLDAAKRVKDPRIRFLIWGDGDERQHLEQRIAQEGIENVKLKGKVPKQFIPSIVSQASLNVVHNAPQTIFRFGISFNKLFDYLAAGKPILCDFPCSYNPAVQCGAGVMVTDPTAEQIAEAIERMAGLPEEKYQTYCAAACRGAQEYDYQQLTKKLIAIIEGMG